MRCAATPRASGPPGDAGLLHTCVLRTEQPLFSQKGLRCRGRVGSAGVRRGEFVHQMKKPAALAKDAQVRGRGALSVPTSPGEEHRLEDTTGPSRPGDTAVSARAALAYLRDDRGRRAAVTGSAQNQPRPPAQGKIHRPFTSDREQTGPETPRNRGDVSRGGVQGGAPSPRGPPVVPGPLSGPGGAIWMLVRGQC